jgi:hypothetical protein
VKVELRAPIYSLLARTPKLSRRACDPYPDSALALEAQLRGMSLGQLVGAIIAGAMDGLSGLLDGEPSAEDAGVASRE